MPLKILAASDLHLGRKSADLHHDQAVASAAFTWNNMVDYAVRTPVDLFLLSGDIVDEDNRYFEALGPLQEGFDRLSNAGVPVVMVAGNHDYEVLPQLVAHRQWKNVHLLGKDGQWEYINLRIKDLDIGLAGWSFPQRHISYNPLLSFDAISGDIRQDALNIGILHGDLNMRESRYAPFRLADLRQHPLNLWLLGHIHKPDFYGDDTPIVAYPGSPHALSAAEPGLHGPMLFTIHGKHDIRHETLPMSAARYEDVAIELQEGMSGDDFRAELNKMLDIQMDRLAEELDDTKHLIFTLRLKGHHEKPEDIYAWATESLDFSQSAGNTVVSIRKVHHTVEPALGDLHELSAQASVAGRLARVILSIEKEAGNELVEEMLDAWQRKAGQLNVADTYAPLRQAERLPGTTREEGLAHILQESKRLLSHMLRHKDTPQH